MAKYNAEINGSNAVLKRKQEVHRIVSKRKHTFFSLASRAVSTNRNARKSFARSFLERAIRKWHFFANLRCWTAAVLRLAAASWSALDC